MKKYFPEAPVLMAVIGAPHGVKGDVRVKPFTEDPLGFTDYGLLFAKDGRQFEVLQARLQKTVVVTRFKGVSNRRQVEALNGLELYVDRSVLPNEVLEEDEFYLTDLIGMELIAADGTSFGVVRDVPNFGADDLVEYVPTGKSRTEFLPFTKEVFPEIDFETGKLTVMPPEEVSERDASHGNDTVGKDWKTPGNGSSSK